MTCTEFSLNAPIGFNSERKALKFMRKYLIGNQHVALCLVKSKKNRAVGEVTPITGIIPNYQVRKYNKHMKFGSLGEFLIGFDKTSPFLWLNQ
jgi:hypothetical protein